jgi:hypothetical protein
MTAPTCVQCSRPMGDQAYVCSVCADKDRAILMGVAQLAPEIEAAVAKLSRFTQSAGGSGGRPLPVDLGKAADAAAVGNTVSTWARHVAESRGLTIGWPEHGKASGPLCRKAWSCAHRSCERIRVRPRTVGIAVAAEFLAGQVEWLRHQPEAGEAFDELRYAAGLLERLLGGPSPRWYAGPCRAPLVDDDGVDTGELCEVDLYAAPGAATVRCRSCGATDDAQARKEWLLDEAQDALVHAELMARALTALGIEDMTPARVRGMARHGRLLPKGVNAAGDPTYRVGDVLAVVEEQDRAEAERLARRDAKAARRAERTADAQVVDRATISPHDRSTAGEVSPNQGGPRLSCA